MADTYECRKRHGVERIMRISGLEPLNYRPDLSNFRKTFLKVRFSCSLGRTSPTFGSPSSGCVSWPLRGVFSCSLGEASPASGSPSSRRVSWPQTPPEEQYPEC